MPTKHKKQRRRKRSKQTTQLAVAGGLTAFAVSFAVLMNWIANRPSAPKETPSKSVETRETLHEQPEKTSLPPSIKNETKVGDERQAQKLWTVGQTLLGAEDYDGAIERFEQLLKEYPQSSFAPKAEEGLESAQREKEAADLCAAGQDALENERYSEAVEKFDRVGRRFADTKSAPNARKGLEAALTEKTAAALFKLAEEAFERGRYESAVKGYETLLKRCPKSKLAPEARKWLAKAQKSLDKGLTAQKASRLYRAGLEAYRAKQYDKAIDQFSKLLADYPESEHCPKAQELLKKAKSQKAQAESRAKLAVMKPIGDNAWVSGIEHEQLEGAGWPSERKVNLNVPDSVRSTGWTLDTNNERCILRDPQRKVRIELGRVEGQWVSPDVKAKIEKEGLHYVKNKHEWKTEQERVAEGVVWVNGSWVDPMERLRFHIGRKYRTLFHPSQEKPLDLALKSIEENERLHKQHDWLLAAADVLISFKTKTLTRDEKAIGRGPDIQVRRREQEFLVRKHEERFFALLMRYSEALKMFLDDGITSKALSIIPRSRVYVQQAGGQRTRYFTDRRLFLAALPWDEQSAELQKVIEKLRKVHADARK